MRKSKSKAPETFTSDPTLVLIQIATFTNKVASRKGIGNRFHSKLQSYGLSSCSNCLETQESMNQATCSEAREQLESWLDEIELNAVNGQNKSSWQKFLVEFSTESLRRKFCTKRLKAAIAEQEEEDDVLDHLSAKLLGISDLPEEYQAFLNKTRALCGIE